MGLSKSEDEPRRLDRALFREAVGGIAVWAIVGWIPAGITVFVLAWAFDSSLDVGSVYLGGFISLLLFAGVFWLMSRPSKPKFSRFGSGPRGSLS